MQRLRRFLDVRVATTVALFSSATVPVAFANLTPHTPPVTGPTLDGQIVWITATHEAEHILEHAAAWTAGEPGAAVVEFFDGDGGADYDDVAPIASALVALAFEIGRVPERLDLDGDDLFDGQDIDPFNDRVVLGDCP